MLTARLALELEAVRATLARTSRARLRVVSPDGCFYLVEFTVRTLVQGDDGIVREEERVVPVSYELSSAHPLEPPIAIALQRDLFNVHIRDPRQPSPLPPLPFICLGSFRPEHRLADWISATYAVLAYARLATHHGLNPQALAFARRALGTGRFPIDPTPFFAPLSEAPAR